MRAYKEWWPDSSCSSGDIQQKFRESTRDAKTYCNDCPVKIDCLNYALLYDEEGIWGGTTKIQRAQILKASPQILDYLTLEAMQAQILEDRYTIDRYFDEIRQARKLARDYGRQQSTQVHPVATAPVQSLTELQELLGEWSIQWVS